MTAQQSTVATTAAPNRAVSVGGRAAGVVGVVICAVLIVLVLLGRGWAVDKVHSVAGSIDDALAKGIPLLDQVSGKVSDVNDRLGLVGAAAATIGSGANTPPAVQRLSSALSSVSEQYLPLRTAYADARARIVSVSDRLQTLDAIVPFISLPQGPGDALQALDERVVALDAAVMSILDANVGANAASAISTAVTDRVGKAQSTLTDVEGRLADVKARVEQTRTDVASTADTIANVITLAAIVIVLILAWVAFLHVLLYRTAEQAGNPAA